MHMLSPFANLKRLLGHFGLAAALLFAQLGVLTHYHPDNLAEIPSSLLKAQGKSDDAAQATDLCQLCVAYHLFSAAAPVHYHALAQPLAAQPTPEARAHGTPFYLFDSYASRGPPSAFA